MTTRNPNGTFWLTAPEVGHRPTRAAGKAGETLAEMFEQGGVHCRSGDSVECLATIIERTQGNGARRMARKET